MVLLLPDEARAQRGEAQQRCAAALTDARERYRIGLLDDVIPRLDLCIRHPDSAGRMRGFDGGSRSQRAEALALVAKVHVTRDDAESARTAILLLLLLDAEFIGGTDDPPLFRRLLSEARAAARDTQVTSVSRSAENLREAPATVAVVTAAEIAERGYRDLEAVLHDLPGFDFARGNGDAYSNVYMRGFRSGATDRTLFLIDGIEQNDLHSSVAWLSRQYPLSNVDRVEVIYGPASTLYGADAYTGVINVITKSPEQLLATLPGQLPGDTRRLAISGQLGGGTYGTRYLDVTAAGRTRGADVRFAVTGRFFASDERDLSEFADWDFSGDELASVDYAARLNFDYARLNPFVCELFPSMLAARQAGIVTFPLDDEGCVAGLVELTPAGVELARSVDRAFLQAHTFEDPTRDWGIHAKLAIGDLRLGMMRWRRKEGTSPWYRDTARLSGAGRALWTPQHTSLFASYSRPISETLSFNIAARFKQHELDRDSTLAQPRLFAGGDIHLIHLLERVFGDAGPAPLFGEPFEAPFANRFAFDQVSRQFRTELTTVFTPSTRLTVVSGLDVRLSNVQGDLHSGSLGVISRVFLGVPFPALPGPPSSGFFANATPGEVRSRDLGSYAQASWSVTEDLKLVAGGRVDHNSIPRGQEIIVPLQDLGRIADPDERDRARFGSQLTVPRGYGSVFNPRLAVIYSPGELVFKGIYAEAFVEPSASERFTRVPRQRDLPNPFLEPEEVRNFELAAGWRRTDGARNSAAAKTELSVELSAYQAEYSNVVDLISGTAILNEPDSEFVSFIAGKQLANLGSVRVRGLQAGLRARRGDLVVQGNYTYTDPVSTDPRNETGDPLFEGDRRVTELRIGDIAAHRINVSAAAPLIGGLSGSLRLNYASDRPTGPGTTVLKNPFAQIDGYLLAHAALTYRDVVPGVTWQLVVDNVFDTQYWDPGVLQAGEGVFAARIPQPGRVAIVRVLFDLPGGGGSSNAAR